jgi:hypothetical protein
MNIREIFNFKKSLYRIKLDDEKEETSSNSEDNLTLNTEEEIQKELSNEWNQEYELIYLSYVLER